MCTQLDLQKTPKKEKDHLIFINLGIKKFTILKALKKEKCKHYNLIGSMEQRVFIF
jgi:hypothetical protein